MRRGRSSQLGAKEARSQSQRWRLRLLRRLRQLLGLLLGLLLLLLLLGVLLLGVLPPLRVGDTDSAAGVVLHSRPTAYGTQLLSACLRAQSAARCSALKVRRAAPLLRLLWLPRSSE